MNPFKLLTARGWTIFLGGLLLAGVSKLLFKQPALLWYGLFLTLLPIISLLISRIPRNSLEFSRRITPQRTSVGSPAVAKMELQMKFPISPALLEFEDKVDPLLGNSARFRSDQIFGKWNRRLAYQLPADNRGVYTVGPFLAHGADPFGLARTKYSIPVTSEVIVTPKIWTLPPISLTGPGTTGEDSPMRLGALGHDDVLVREHRHGDDLRRVHWRSTAKHGELMVRREEQSTDPAATLFLDSRQSSFTDKDRFEWAVSAAASIALHLLEAKYKVRLLDADGLKINSSHSDPTSNSAEVLMAMTLEKLSTRTDIEYALSRSGAVSGAESFIATKTISSTYSPKIIGKYYK
ncbi:MAG: hypothetical protein CR979_01410 [Propionibacterium sp.]|nr:MAG: hypothetical protein CR979_01410 [Propionibacterium sp.]